MNNDRKRSLEKFFNRTHPDRTAEEIIFACEHGLSVLHERESKCEWNEWFKRMEHVVKNKSISV